MTKEEFNRIIDKYLTGEATSAERRLVDNFFSLQEKNQSPITPPVIDEMWREIESRINIDAIPPKARGLSVRSYAFMGLSVIIFMIAGLIGYWQTRPTKVEWITKVAPYGEKSILMLADGSKVFLNSGSTISYPKEFARDLREIILVGEAFFEVARNPSQPFHVRSGNVVTKVLGTSFNVQAFDGGEISVTVATGKVQVVASVDDPDYPANTVCELILNPRQHAVFHNMQWTTSEVELPKSLAWKNNTLRFEETALSGVAATLERWYNVKIEFQDKGILNCRINGQFKDQSLDEVLKSIQYMYNVRFKFLTQNQIILYGKGCAN